uniref:Condensin2 complex subunit D3 putative n=1 Tax=Albugo laibachii Nc14 TaxID=890382 RepID=F0WNG2_9STRA|nr:condensin2 complex subunit D3 putative [Albugo laibachii Nc14]|eukprot:CCA22853.1 condensin2 complex subunit D3 putative [Albugo laibachii Nc14]
MHELELELMEALEALPLSSLDQEQCQKLVQSGAVQKLPQESLLIKQIEAFALRKIDKCMHQYHTYELDEGRDEIKTPVRQQSKPSQGLWRFLTSKRDAGGIGNNPERPEKHECLHIQFFSILHVAMNSINFLDTRVRQNGTEEAILQDRMGTLLKAVLAAKIYLGWIQLPGGTAYGVWIPQQYLCIMKILRKWIESFSLTIQDDQTNEHEKKVTSTRLKKLVKNTRLYGMQLLKTLSNFLKIVSLKAAPDCIVTSIETIIYLQRMDCSMGSIADVNDKFLLIFESLQGTMHGDPEQMNRRIIHFYVPFLTFNEKAFGGTHFSRAALPIHRTTIATLEAIEQQLSSQLEATKSHSNDRDGVQAVISRIRLALVQNICMSVPERSERRQRVLQFVFKTGTERLPTTETIRSILVDADRAKFVCFLYSYSHQKTTKFRQFSVELATKLLLTPAFWKCNSDRQIPKELSQYTGVTSLIEILVQRSNDLVSGVRAKAITGISTVITVGFQNNTLSGPEDTIGTQELHLDESELRTLTSALQKAFHQKTQEPNTNQLNGDIISLFQTSLTDDKMSVRRAAVQALEALVTANLLQLDSDNPDLLFQLRGRCNDTSVLVRAQAIKSLTNILIRNPNNRNAQKIWLTGVLPLCADPEVSVQKRILEAGTSVICDQLFLWHRQFCQQFPSTTFIWQLIEDIDASTIRCIQRTIRLLIENSSLDQHRIITVSMHAVKLSITSKDYSAKMLNLYWNFGWSMLEEVTRTGKKVMPESDAEREDYLETVVACWDKLQKGELRSEFTEGAKRILRVLATLASLMDADDATRIADSIMTSLLTFSAPVNVITDAAYALSHMCKAKAPDTKQGLEINRAWSSKLLSLCEENLQSYAQYHPNIIVENSVLVEKQLVCLGEMVVLEFNKEADKASIEDLSNVALLPVSDSTKSIVQLFLPPELRPLSKSQQDAAELTVKIPKTVRVCAFLALGKICLRDEDFSKRCVTMLIRELRTSPEQEIRSNVLLILGDLCVRYTGLIDIYVPTIGLSILDSSPLVRRNALLIFSQLILQDFIKWKDSLHRYFFRSLVDDCEEIASLARHILQGPMRRKVPHLFTSKFVELVFVFNVCKQRKLTDDSADPEDDAKYALVGPSLLPKRMCIYSFLLEHMEDEQKLRLSMQLCTEVLEEVIEDRLQLCSNPSQVTQMGVEAVLKDTFLVLCLPSIKMTGDNDKGDGDVEAAEELEDDRTVSSKVAAAKGKLLSKLSKKNFLENVVPLLIGLKHKLESKRSPLMRYLMYYTHQLFKLYREEVKDILSADPQMAVEIEYDLRQFELHQNIRHSQASPMVQGCIQTPLLKNRRSSLRPMNKPFNSEISVDDVTAALAKIPLKKKSSPNPRNRGRRRDLPSRPHEDDLATMLFSPKKPRMKSRRESSQAEITAIPASQTNRAAQDAKEMNEKSPIAVDKSSDQSQNQANGNQLDNANQDENQFDNTSIPQIRLKRKRTERSQSKKDAAARRKRAST